MSNMNNQTVKSAPPTESQLRNVQAVKTIQNVDISEKGLSERTNKQVDEGFINNPTSDKFITTKEKPRGIAQYPVLLLHDLGSETMKEVIRKKLESYNKGKTEILVLYKRGTTAVTLCKTTTMAEVGELLLDYCLKYTYFIEKGVTQEVDFINHFDFSELERDIIQDFDNMPSIKKAKVIKQDKENEELITKALSYIQDILNTSSTELTTTTSQTDLRERYLSELGLVKEEEKTLKDAISTMSPTSMANTIIQEHVKPVEDKQLPTQPTENNTTQPVTTDKKSIIGFGD